MPPKKQKGYYEKVYPIIFNQYRLFYDEISRYDTKFQIFLAFFGLLFLVYFELGFNKVAYNNYFLVGYLVAILISIYQIVPRKMWFTLIREDKINKHTKVEDVYKLAKEDIFGVGFHINRCTQSKKISLMVVINLTLITSGLILLNYFCSSNFKTYFVLGTILLAIALIVTNYFYDKEYTKHGL